MTHTCATLFSGGGGFDVGAKAAGFTPICANEYDPAIAAVYAQNLGDHVRVGDILLENPRDWPDATLYHSSPPCPNFSAAKTNAAETPNDIALATKVAEFIAVKKPRWFTLENVPAYRKSASFAIICKALGENGYMYDAPVLNSADFGVPQTRKRLFLRATRDGLLRPLPEPTRWVGWLEAIADILDTLPESEFAEWQLKRLPKELADNFIMKGGDLWTPPVSGDQPIYTVGASGAAHPNRAFIANTNASERGDVLREEAKPAYTVTGGGSGGQSRAFIMRSSNVNQEGGNQVRFDETPAMTISAGERPRAFIIDGKPLNYAGELSITPESTPTPTITSTQPQHPFRAWLSQGRVVKMTPHALARFQSFPDWYQLPEKTALACRIIGNAVPPLMAAAVLRSLRNEN